MKQSAIALLAAVGLVVVTVALWSSHRDRIAAALLGTSHEPPGLLIANSGPVDINMVHVSYPGGTYTIHGLPHGGGADTRPIHLRGHTRIALGIRYSDGREFQRTVEVALPEEPQLFQIAIEDGGELHLR